MGTAGVMTDSYIGGIGTVSFIPEEQDTDQSEQHPNQIQINTGGSKSKPGKDVQHKPVLSAWDSSRVDNQTDEDKIVGLTPDAPNTPKSTNINKTEEYNVGYAGLSILPWEEFAFNPNTFDDLFYMETNQKITYDPDEVNVFFHGKNVMPPTVGDISENGNSWNIVVTTMNELRQIRQFLTERSSVFGVTLVYKKKQFSKPQRAPCLVMLDPNRGNIGDKLYTTITRAMDSLHNDRQFCVEINLNGCVERWCERVLLTDCEAVGAKLIITSGEEYSRMNNAEDIVCCIACFPVWLIQTGIYKLHRAVVYDDFFITFDADDLFLHGTFQDTKAQRQQIFHSSDIGQVFRTRSSQQTDMKTLQDLGSFKFICVKKYDKAIPSDEDSDPECINRISQHSTTPFSELVQKRKIKVISKEMKIQKRTNQNKNVLMDVIEENQLAKQGDQGSDLKKFKPRESVNSISQIGFSSEQEGQDNNAFADSDNEVTVEKTPRIPEMTHMLCADDKEGFEERDVKKTSEIYEVRGQGALFSPRVEHDSPSLSMNNKFLDESSSDDDDADVKKFKIGESSDDLETDTDSDTPRTDDANKAGKLDLIDEMRKIEQTLPVEKKVESSSANNSDDSKLDGKKGKTLKKKKSKSKSKDKTKPSVGKVFKDLMKTTEDMHTQKPSTTDSRYLQAKDKLSKNKSKAKVTRAEVNTKKESKSVIDNVNDAEKTETLKGSPKISENNTSVSEEISNAVKMFSTDDSSTDGEDVEMIYQSNNLPKSGFDIPGRKTPTVIQTQPMHGESLNFVSKDIRDNVFQTKKSFKMQNSFKLGNSLRKDPSDGLLESKTEPNVITDTADTTMLKSTELIEEDLDGTDSGTDGDFTKSSGHNVMNASDNKVVVPPLKLKFGETQKKKSRRKVNRGDSKGKYLGAAVLKPSKRT